MGGDTHDPRDQVGVDPTVPASEATRGGDADDDALDRERERGSGSGSSAGAHVTGGPAPADAEPVHPVWGYPFPAAGPPDLDPAIQPDDEDVRLRWPCVCPVDEEHDPESGCLFNKPKAVDVHAWREQVVLLQATRDRLADLEARLKRAREALIAVGYPHLVAALDGPAAQEEDRGG